MTGPRVLLLSPRDHPGARAHLAAAEAGLRAGGAEILRIEPPGPLVRWIAEPAGAGHGEVDGPTTHAGPARSSGPAGLPARTGTAGRAGRAGQAGRASRVGAELAGRGWSVWHAVLRTRALGPVDAVVVGQVDLIPVAAVAVRLTGARRAPVLFHDTAIWTIPPHLRLLLRRDPAMYPVATSSFSAGALSTLGTGAVLAPGLARPWREMLLAEAARRRPLPPVPTVLSVFPLDAWEAKGLPTLIEAMDAVSRELGPLRLVIAGAGPAPGALHEYLAAREHTELHESPGDEALARLYATADLFALCTRTRATAPVSGEGYGMALIEAQLAGCAVIGPARGGSRDAYQDGVSGRTPSDESPRALAHILRALLADRARLARAGRRATEWARAATDPDDHTRAVFGALLGREPVAGPAAQAAGPGRDPALDGPPAPSAGRGGEVPGSAPLPRPAAGSRQVAGR